MPRLSAASIAMGQDAVRASEIPMLLDISPYGGPHALWLRKIGATPPPEFERLSQRIGHLLEPAVRELTAERQHVRIRENSETRRHRLVPLIATPDGFVARPAAVYEGKTRAFPGEWGDPDDPSGIPARHRAQVAAQMAVWGKRRGLLAVLIEGYDPRAYWIERDRELVDAIVEAVADFWPYVERREPPPLDGSDDAAAYLRKRFRPETGREIVATAEQTFLVDELRTAAFGKLEAEARLELAKQRVVEVLTAADAQVLISPAGKVKWLTKRGNPAWKLIAENLRKAYVEARDGARSLAPFLTDEELDALVSLHTAEDSAWLDHPFDRRAMERSAA